MLQSPWEQRMNQDAVVDLVALVGDRCQHQGVAVVLAAVGLGNGLVTMM